jgi:hypothetical protein
MVYFLIIFMIIGSHGRGLVRRCSKYFEDPITSTTVTNPVIFSSKHQQWRWRWNSEFFLENGDGQVDELPVLNFQ